MINNPAKAKAMGEKASRMVREKYDWDNIVQDIEKVYLEALDEKNSESISLRASHPTLNSRRNVGL
jgi:predicted NAD-dependent protein-ADP-ribosyltransferase YbiA (DUF1768 family)